MATAKDYRNDIRPNWCPGCGHYGVQAAITDAVVAKNIPPEKLAVISGIGCSSLRLRCSYNSWSCTSLRSRRKTC